ncbi:MAG: hypothetical protein JKY65_13330 [Planctomycetes bacterium]|nr:hypothetical protein [Planctomycetota bacterium]
MIHSILRFPPPSARLIAALTAVLGAASVCAAQGPPFPPPDVSGKARAVFWIVDKTPKNQTPKSSWFGYPVKRTRAVEIEVERQVNAIRKQHGLVVLRPLEELRFLGRLHAREWDALGGGGHKSPLWGHVSDRAAVLYGWRPTQWVLTPAPAPDKHAICDNFRGGGSDARGYTDAWMASEGHKRAILWKSSRQIGMSLSEGGMAHLMFGGIPTQTLRRLEALRPLYKRLANETKATRLKKLLTRILKIREGSAFVRIAPLLFDSDPKVRSLALKALDKLYRLVPKAKGPLFAIVDLGVMSPDQELSKQARKVMKKLTRQKHETPAEWHAWWHQDAYKRLLVK